MTLEGAQFICLDEAGNRGEIVLAKGRKFSVGYYTSCDLPIEDERAKGVHCTIECDAFGRITIRNFSSEHPISINGEEVDNKRILFNKTTIKILDKSYLWEFSAKNPKEFEDVESGEVSTPQKQIGIPQQSAFSCPDVKHTQKTEPRFTVHNFAYCIQSDEEGNTSLESNANETSTVEGGGDLDVSSKSETKETEEEKEGEVAIKSVEEGGAGREVTPEPESIKTSNEAQETPKMNLINCTNNKENTSSTHKKNHQQLSLCHQSDIVITSFSPRETGVKIEKSFTAILKPKVLVTKPPKTPKTPKSVYSTPKSVLGDDDADDVDENDKSTHVSNFHTPSTSRKATTKCSTKNNTSMHLVDFTTPTKIASTASSPYLKTALKASAKKLNPSTPNTTKSVKSKLAAEEQLGVSALPITPVVSDDNKIQIETPSSVQSVISIDSTDTSSIIEVLSDESTPGTNANAILKTPGKTETGRIPATTPKRTPQSLMKRAILTSTKKQMNTPQRAETPPRREPINRIPLRTSIGSLRSPVTPKSTEPMAQTSRRLSMSMPSRKSMPAAAVAARLESTPSSNTPITPSSTSTRRSSLIPMSASRAQTSTPFSSSSRKHAGCKTSPLNKVRKSIGGIPLSSHISKARRSIIPTSSSTPSHYTSIKEKSPQQVMSGRLVSRARKSLGVSPMISRAISMVQDARAGATTTPSSILKRQQQSTRRSLAAVPMTPRRSVLFSSSKPKPKAEEPDLSRTFVVVDSDDEEKQEAAAKEVQDTKTKTKDGTFSPEVCGGDDAKKEDAEVSTRKDATFSPEKDITLNVTFSPERETTNVAVVTEESQGTKKTCAAKSLDIPLDVEEVTEEEEAPLERDSRGKQTATINTMPELEEEEEEEEEVTSKDESTGDDSKQTGEQTCSTEESFAEIITECKKQIPEPIKTSEEIEEAVEDVHTNEKQVSESYNIKPDENETGFGEESLLGKSKAACNTSKEVVDEQSITEGKSSGDAKLSEDVIELDSTAEGIDAEKSLNDDRISQDKTDTKEVLELSNEVVVVQQQTSFVYKPICEDITLESSTIEREAKETTVELNESKEQLAETAEEDSLLQQEDESQAEEEKLSVEAEISTASSAVKKKDAKQIEEILDPKEAEQQVLEQSESLIEEEETDAAEKNLSDSPDEEGVPKNLHSDKSKPEDISDETDKSEVELTEDGDNFESEGNEDLQSTTNLLAQIEDVLNKSEEYKQKHLEENQEDSESIPTLTEENESEKLTQDSISEYQQSEEDDIEACADGKEECGESQQDTADDNKITTGADTKSDEEKETSVATSSNPFSSAEEGNSDVMIEKPISPMSSSTNKDEEVHAPKAVAENDDQVDQQVEEVKETKPSVEENNDSITDAVSRKPASSTSSSAHKDEDVDANKSNNQIVTAEDEGQKVDVDSNDLVVREKETNPSEEEIQKPAEDEDAAAKKSNNEIETAEDEGQKVVADSEGLDSEKETEPLEEECQKPAEDVAANKSNNEIATSEDKGQKVVAEEETKFPEEEILKPIEDEEVAANNQLATSEDNDQMVVAASDGLDSEKEEKHSEEIQKPAKDEDVAANKSSNQLPTAEDDGQKVDADTDGIDSETETKPSYDESQKSAKDEDVAANKSNNQLATVEDDGQKVVADSDCLADSEKETKPSEEESQKATSPKPTDSKDDVVGIKPAVEEECTDTDSQKPMPAANMDENVAPKSSKQLLENLTTVSTPKRRSRRASMLGESKDDTKENIDVSLQNVAKKLVVETEKESVLTPRRSSRRKSNSMETDVVESNKNVKPLPTFTPRRSSRRASMSAEISNTTSGCSTPTSKKTRRASLSAVPEAPLTPKRITRRRSSISLDTDEAVKVVHQEEESTTSSAGERDGLIAEEMSEDMGAIIEEDEEEDTKSPQKHNITKVELAEGNETMDILNEGDAVKVVIEENVCEILSEANSVAVEEEPPTQKPEALGDDAVKEHQTATAVHDLTQGEEDVAGTVQDLTQDEEEDKNVVAAVQDLTQDEENIITSVQDLTQDEEIIAKDINESIQDLTQGEESIQASVQDLTQDEAPQTGQHDVSISVQEMQKDKESTNVQDMTQEDEGNIDEEEPVQDLTQDEESLCKMVNESVQDLTEDQEEENSCEIVCAEKPEDEVEKATLVHTEDIVAVDDVAEEDMQTLLVSDDESDSDATKVHQNKGDQTPKAKKSVRIAAVVDSPKTPVMTGMRELLKTPKAEPSTPKFRGIRHLVRTPKVKPAETEEDEAEKLLDMQEMVKTPTTVQLNAEEEIDGQRELKGVKELLKTPKSSSTPRFKGMRELMQTPKVSSTPVLGGVKELLETPKLTSPKEAEQLPNEDVVTPTTTSTSKDEVTKTDTTSAKSAQKLLDCPNQVVEIIEVSETTPLALTKDIEKIDKELPKTPKSCATPRFKGMRELMQTPKVSSTPTLTGVKELLATPTQEQPREDDANDEDVETTSPTSTKDVDKNLKGVKDLLKTPKTSAATPRFKGMRELMQTPKVSSTPVMTGVKELLDTPTQEQQDTDEEEIYELQADDDPTPSSKDAHKELRGVKELMKTPKRCSTPRFKGMRELMQTPKVTSTPVLGGLKELMDTPKQHGQDADNLDKFLKTPTAKNIMIPILPSSAVIEKSEDSVEMIHSTEYDLNDTHEDGSTHLEELFKTPVVSRFAERITASFHVDDDGEKEDGNKSIGETNTDLQTPLRKGLPRKSLLLKTPKFQSPFSAAEVLSDLSKTDVEEWVGEIDPLQQTINLDDDDDVQEVKETKHKEDNSVVNLDDSIMECDKPNDSLSIVPESCTKVYSADTSVDVANTSEAMINLSTLGATTSKDPLEGPTTAAKLKENGEPPRPITPMDVADISGINLLDQTGESALDGSLLVSDDDEECGAKEIHQNLSDSCTPQEVENKTLCEEDNDGLTESLLLSDSDEPEMDTSKIAKDNETENVESPNQSQTTTEATNVEKPDESQATEATKVEKPDECQTTEATKVEKPDESQTTEEASAQEEVENVSETCAPLAKSLSTNDEEDTKVAEDPKEKSCADEEEKSEDSEEKPCAEKEEEKAEDSKKKPCAEEDEKVEDPKEKTCAEGEEEEKAAEVMPSKNIANAQNSECEDIFLDDSVDEKSTEQTNNEDTEQQIVTDSNVKKTDKPDNDDDVIELTSDESNDCKVVESTAKEVMPHECEDIFMDDSSVSEVSISQKEGQNDDDEAATINIESSSEDGNENNQVIERVNSMNEEKDSIQDDTDKEANDNGLSSVLVERQKISVSEEEEETSAVKANENKEATCLDESTGGEVLLQNTQAKEIEVTTSCPIDAVVQQSSEIGKNEQAANVISIDDSDSSEEMPQTTTGTCEKILHLNEKKLAEIEQENAKEDKSNKEEEHYSDVIEILSSQEVEASSDVISVTEVVSVTSVEVSVVHELEKTAEDVMPTQEHNVEDIEANQTIVTVEDTSKLEATTKSDNTEKAQSPEKIENPELDDALTTTAEETTELQTLEESISEDTSNLEATETSDITEETQSSDLPASVEGTTELQTLSENDVPKVDATETREIQKLENDESQDITEPTTTATNPEESILDDESKKEDAEKTPETSKQNMQVDDKKLPKTPKSSATPRFKGLRELVQTPKVISTPVMTGVKELLDTPTQEEAREGDAIAEDVETTSPTSSKDIDKNLKGVKDLLKTPKTSATPRFKGMRELMQTPKVSSTPVMTGVKELLDTPTQVQPAADEEIHGLEADEPTTSSKDVHKELRGVKELMKTPKRCSTPRFKGMRELMQTPKVTSTPVLGGLKELMDTPKQETLVKTSKAKRAVTTESKAEETIIDDTKEDTKPAVELTSVAVDDLAERDVVKTVALNKVVSEDISETESNPEISSCNNDEPQKDAKTAFEATQSSENEASVVDDDEIRTTEISGASVLLETPQDISVQPNPEVSILDDEKDIKTTAKETDMSEAQATQQVSVVDDNTAVSTVDEIKSTEVTPAIDNVESQGVSEPIKEISKLYEESKKDTEETADTSEIEGTETSAANTEILGEVAASKTIADTQPAGLDKIEEVTALTSGSESYQEQKEECNPTEEVTEPISSSEPHQEQNEGSATSVVAEREAAETHSTVGQNSETVEALKTSANDSEAKMDAIQVKKTVNASEQPEADKSQAKPKKNQPEAAIINIAVEDKHESQSEENELNKTQSESHKDIHESQTEQHNVESTKTVQDKVLVQANVEHLASLETESAVPEKMMSSTPRGNLHETVKTYDIEVKITDKPTTPASVEEEQHDGKPKKRIRSRKGSQSSVCSDDELPKTRRTRRNPKTEEKVGNVIELPVVVESVEQQQVETKQTEAIAAKSNSVTEAQVKTTEVVEQEEPKEAGQATAEVVANKAEELKETTAPKEDNIESSSKTTSDDLKKSENVNEVGDVVENKREETQNAEEVNDVLVTSERNEEDNKQTRSRRNASQDTIHTEDSSENKKTRRGGRRRGLQDDNVGGSETPTTSSSSMAVDETQESSSKETEKVKHVLTQDAVETKKPAAKRLRRKASQDSVHGDDSTNTPKGGSRRKVQLNIETIEEVKTLTSSSEPHQEQKEESGGTSEVAVDKIEETSSCGPLQEQKEETATCKAGIDTTEGEVAAPSSIESHQEQKEESAAVVKTEEVTAPISSSESHQENKEEESATSEAAVDKNEKVAAFTSSSESHQEQKEESAAADKTEEVTAPTSCSEPQKEEGSAREADADKNENVAPPTSSSGSHQEQKEEVETKPTSSAEPPRKEEISTTEKTIHESVEEVKPAGRRTRRKASTDSTHSDDEISVHKRTKGGHRKRGVTSAKEAALDVIVETPVEESKSVEISDVHETPVLLNKDEGDVLKASKEGDEQNQDTEAIKEHGYPKNSQDSKQPDADITSGDKIEERKETTEDQKESEVLEASKQMAEAQDKGTELAMEPANKHSRRKASQDSQQGDGSSTTHKSSSPKPDVTSADKIEKLEETSQVQEEISDVPKTESEVLEASKQSTMAQDEHTEIAKEPINKRSRRKASQDSQHGEKSAITVAEGATENIPTNDTKTIASVEIHEAASQPFNKEVETAEHHHQDTKVVKQPINKRSRRKASQDSNHEEEDSSKTHARKCSRRRVQLAEEEKEEQTAGLNKIDEIKETTVARVQDEVAMETSDVKDNKEDTQEKEMAVAIQSVEDVNKRNRRKDVAHTDEISTLPTRRGGRRKAETTADVDKTKETVVGASAQDEKQDNCTSVVKEESEQSSDLKPQAADEAKEEEPDHKQNRRKAVADAAHEDDTTSAEHTRRGGSRRKAKIAGNEATEETQTHQEMKPDDKADVKEAEEHENKETKLADPVVRSRRRGNQEQTHHEADNSAKQTRRGGRHMAKKEVDTDTATTSAAAQPEHITADEAEEANVVDVEVSNKSEEIHTKDEEKASTKQAKHQHSVPETSTTDDKPVAEPAVRSRRRGAHQEIPHLDADNSAKHTRRGGRHMATKEIVHEPATSTTSQPEHITADDMSLKAEETKVVDVDKFEEKDHNDDNEAVTASKRTKRQHIVSETAAHEDEPAKRRAKHRNQAPAHVENEEPVEILEDETVCNKEKSEPCDPVSDNKVEEEPQEDKSRKATRRKGVVAQKHGNEHHDEKVTARSRRARKVPGDGEDSTQPAEENVDPKPDGEIVNKVEGTEHHTSPEKAKTTRGTARNARKKNDDDVDDDHHHHEDEHDHEETKAGTKRKASAKQTQAAARHEVKATQSRRRVGTRKNDSHEDDHNDVHEADISHDDIITHEPTKSVEAHTPEDTKKGRDRRKRDVHKEETTTIPASKGNTELPSTSHAAKTRKRKESHTDHEDLTHQVEIIAPQTPPPPPSVAQSSNDENNQTPESEKRARNMPQRRAANAYHNYDETSDSEKPEKKKKKTESPRKSLETSKITTTAPDAAKSAESSSDQSPNQLSGSTTTARGRTRKPTARVQKFLEEERAKAESPKKRGALATVAATDTPTKRQTARRGAKTIVSESEVAVVQESAEHQEPPQPSSDSNRNDDESKKPEPTTTTSKVRKGARKAKANVHAEHIVEATEEPPAKKSPLQLQAEKEEVAAQTTPDGSTPTRTTGKRNAAAAAKARIEEDALAAAAVEAPKKSRAKKSPVKAAAATVAPAAKRDHRLASSSTVEGGAEEDLTAEEQSHTAAKRGSRKASVTTSATDSPVVPVKRSRKAKATTETDEIEAADEPKPTGRAAARSRKNVHFNATQTPTTSEQPEVQVAVADEAPPAAAATTKRATRLRRK